MRYDYSQIPDDMRNEPRWVLWRKVTRDGRVTKIPVDASTFAGAKSNDPSTWADFATCLRVLPSSGCDGLGFMLGDGWFGIDLDHVSSMKGNAKDDFLSQLDTYCETSQSGDGLHFICRGKLPEGARRRGGIEMYDSGRYFALTGDIYNDKRFCADCTKAVIPLLRKYLGAEYTYEEANAKLSDSDLIAKASAGRNGNLFSMLYYGQWQELGYASQSEADAAFCMHLAFWSGRDADQMDRIFRGSGLMRDKWDQLRGKDTYGRMTVASAISKCNTIYGSEANGRTAANGQAVSPSKRYELDDTGNAQRFVDSFGDSVRYNFDNRKWMVFDGMKWKDDVRQEVKGMVDSMIAKMRKEAFDEDDKEKLKNVKRLSSNSGKEAMLKEAQHMGGVPVTNADFDQSDFLLNCRNGIVDLRDGSIKPHDRNEMMAKCASVNVDMQGEPTRWLKFLDEIFKGDAEMIEYVRRAVGYTLTGDTREQCFFQCFGNGANGKSVFFDILHDALGDYALNAQVDSILAKGSMGGASSEIARMSGARLVRTNEPNEGSRLNEGLVKQLVSGDVTTARFLYGNEFEFKPRFKLWIATNYKINIRGSDKGIWRRVRLIPFTAEFEGREDKVLSLKLKTELPQILGWAVKGAVDWFKGGLTSPKAVKQANEDYKTEMDVIGSFMADCCRLSLTGMEKASDVYAAYSEWARIGHEYCMSLTKFGGEMKKRFERTMRGGYAYYKGFVLAKHDGSYDYYDE